MQSNASERFFWPSLNAAIQQCRSKCKRCNENAPSQPSESMMISAPPAYPFQQSVTDFAKIEGHDFLIYADRYSGWAEVAKLGSTAWRMVCQAFLKWFAAFGVPEEMSSDGGPPFNAFAYDEFLSSWGISKRQSSAHYPQSNGRAEAAVKTAKRILEGNVNPVTGQLDTEAAARALLSHRNTPLQDTGFSPAMSLYGRPMRDHLPRQMDNIRQKWQIVADARESAYAKRQLRQDPRLTDRVLEDLKIGDAVQIQNQTGNRPRKWYATGIIVECLPHRQYKVIVDGSRRLTLRNRKFLRRIDPTCRKEQSPALIRTPVRWENDSQVPPPILNTPSPHHEQGPQASTPEPPLHASPDVPQQATTPRIPHAADPIPRRRILREEEVPAPVRHAEEDIDQDNHDLRRSTRIRKPRVRFSPQLRGKSHCEEE